MRLRDCSCQVLAICDAQGLIGREMFAIGGVKLPSNACKTKIGTRTDFMRPPLDGTAAQWRNNIGCPQTRTPPSEPAVPSHPP